jgi:hypothetical protein
LRLATAGVMSRSKPLKDGRMRLRERRLRRALIRGRRKFCLDLSSLLQDKVHHKTRTRREMLSQRIDPKGGSGKIAQHENRRAVGTRSKFMPSSFDRLLERQRLSIYAAPFTCGFAFGICCSRSLEIEQKLNDGRQRGAISPENAKIVQANAGLSSRPNGLLPQSCNRDFRITGPDARGSSH